MRPVTIDKFDIKIHERYAKDQEQLDPTYIKESSAVALHPEIAGTSSIFSSNWEVLFDIQIKNIPWANFSPPFRYTVQSNRFFAYRLLPTIDLDDEEDQEEEEEEKEKKERHSRFELIKKILNTKKVSTQAHEIFESEKTALINFLESAKYLDRMLKHVNARKRQYQKG